MTKGAMWEGLHNIYLTEDWIDKPNFFAQEVLQYFPKKGSILCLGDGQGQDGRFFASLGYTVTSTDVAELAIKTNKEKIKKEKLKNIVVQKLDLREKFPFKDGCFDIVYSHLSVHYFNRKITHQIFEEIYRVLKPGGTVAIFTNSTDDPEYNTGKKLEDDFFEIEGFEKRFFSVETLKEFTKSFETVLLDNKGKTYKDEAKGVHNLIRYIGRKI